MHPAAVTRRPPVPGREGTAPDAMAMGSGILGLLGEIRELLENLQTSPTRVAFGGSYTEQRLANWPVSGHQRIVARGRVHGGTQVLPAAAYTDLMSRDAGRGGLSIVNTGVNPVYVYLAPAGDAQNGGTPTGWLTGGGDWDGKISDELWCGAVSVQSPLGTSIALAVI